MAICSGISYDAGNDRITVEFVDGDVKGNSFNDPYIFQDIYDTDVDGGWGVFQKYGNVYISDASIWIEGSDTYFKDSDFVLSFQGSIDSTYILRIRPLANVHLENGLCYYNIDEKGFFFNSENININDFAFKNVKYPYSFEGIYENITMIDCCYGWYVAGGVSINYLDIEGTIRGLWLQDSATLNNINVKNFRIGIVLRYSSTVSNIKMYNITYDYIFYFSKSTPQVFNVIDSQIDIDNYGDFVFSKETNYTLNLKSTFKVNISGGDGGTATLYDQFGSQVAQQTLSGQWELTDPVLYAKRYVETDGSSVVENTKTVYEPFKLVVTKNGYNTLEIPNIMVTAGEETNVFGEMVLVEVTGENLQHTITEDTLQHTITEDKLEHVITD